MIFTAPSPNEPIDQADVFDGCPIFGLDTHDEGVDLNASPARWRERVIVLTQACDLAQTKTTRVVVAVVHVAQTLVERSVLKAQAIRDQIRRGQVYGWYYVPAAPPPIAFPESIVDLRDLHTVPRAVLEKLAVEGKRICRIQSPYREHLAQHFAVTYMRIGLPVPFATEPD